MDLYFKNFEIGFYLFFNSNSSIVIMVLMSTLWERIWDVLSDYTINFLGTVCHKNHFCVISINHFIYSPNIAIFVVQYFLSVSMLPFPSAYKR